MKSEHPPRISHPSSDADVGAPRAPVPLPCPAVFDGYSFEQSRSPAPAPLSPADASFHNFVHTDASTLAHRVIGLEYIYGMLGLVLGLTCILGGVILGLRGVTGSTSWTAKAVRLSSNVNDATPGVVLFIVGIFLVWITKPKLHFKNTSPGN
jgi:hypothetical protein